MSEPESGSPRGRIWLFDRRDFLLRQFGQTLAASGFSVQSSDQYSYPPVGCAPDEEPDLVVLACTSAGEDEKDLVQRAAARHHHILVLVAARNPWVMRSLFLAGAYDVTGTPVHLVALVEQTLEKALRGRRHEALVSTRGS